MMFFFVTMMFIPFLQKTQAQKNINNKIHLNNTSTITNVSSSQVINNRATETNIIDKETLYTPVAIVHGSYNSMHFLIQLFLFMV